MWHIFPILAVFFTLMGIQLFVGYFIAFVFVMIVEDPVLFNSIWEHVGMFLIILFNALLPSIALFPIALGLDELTRNRAVWLKLVLPLPFILVSVAFLMLAYILCFPIGVFEYTHTWWFSLMSAVVILLIVTLGVIFAFFVPYWYLVQIQRFLAWFVKKTIRAISKDEASVWLQ